MGDEDLRSDRQPEFTQLDIELSFITENTIITMMENMIKSLFKNLLNIELPKKFDEMSYEESLKKYNSDKPDLRNQLRSEWAPVWIKKFPMFKEDEDRISAFHHPFT